MENSVNKTVSEPQPEKKEKGKKIILNLGIALGCIAFFVGAFLVTTSVFTPKQPANIQDGRAIIQKVEKSSEGCGFIIRLDGEDLELIDKDPEVCNGLEEGMDITEQILSSN